MTDYTELVKKLRDLHRDPRPASTVWLFDNQLALYDAAAAIEALQAGIKRLKEANDELREAQTYIDHYGDRWLTSAKDVPTAAYEHGYADGRNEAEAQLPKRGEWIDGDARRVTARCSVCGHLRLGNGAEWANKHVHFCEVCGSRMGDEKA